MAPSTRSFSPAGDASGPGSPELSPRSKIKALLATVDDGSSDDDNSGPIDTEALFQSLDKLKTTTTATTTTTTTAAELSPAEDEESEEEDIVRPRGRIAAQMQANDTTKQSQTSKSPPRSPHRVSSDNEDEEIASVPRKRRVVRPVRSPTPEGASNRERSESPGLFVSPNASPRKSTAGSDTEDELPSDLTKSARFQALVARKRKEQLVKKAEEKRKRDERAKRMAEQTPAGEDSEDDDVSDISDDDEGRKLTQEVRPAARKASKKAIEEMNRETQRINRSMQLAHEAKTKKKISKSALFERFNYKIPGATTAAASETGSTAKIASSSRPTTPGSAAPTDVEMGEDGTPPSSPPSTVKKIANASTTVAPQVEEKQQESVIQQDDDMELPSLEEVLQQTKKLDKGKGIATAEDLKSHPTKKSAPVKPKRQVRVKLPAVQVNTITVDSDDDDGLQILDAKKSKVDKIFDRVPRNRTQESKSMHALRQLAHLSSSPPPARGKMIQKPAMTPAELQVSLVQRARAQAKLERKRRMDMLKAKGIHVQTAEEREKEQEQVEDIVARARKEAEEIMQREREDAKKANKEARKNGEDDPLDWDDSDDDSFEGSDEEGAKEPEEIELSGSEEEEEEGDKDEEQESAANPLFDEAAEEDDESEKEETVQAPENMASDEEMDDEISDIAAKLKSRPRSKKHAKIISDDEDEDEAATPKAKTAYKSPSGTNANSPKAPTSVLRSATKTFIPGLPVPAAGPAGLGLTQIFAGTMDDSQGAGPADGSPLEFMPSFANFPDSQFSATSGADSPSKNVDMVLDSQTETQTQGVQLHFEQSQMHGLDSLVRMQDEGATQASDWILEPTQDSGFGVNSPLKTRFVEPPQSTVDTVLAEDREASVVQNSPLVNRRRGKLRRPGEAAIENNNSTSTVPDTAPMPDFPDIPHSPSVHNTMVPASNNQEGEAQDSASAFKRMQKAARRIKRRQAKCDLKKNKHEMVQGEAEESEDEYAGLGGADGEDSSDEEEFDELRKKMIDDDYKLTEADEAKMAGFFADRERKADEAKVDKLFRDITTGMLRKRRRGGGDVHDFDLSDSDDGGEARRRMKRREFAKMQKALFADERIGKIAENPRNAAFLKSIEDRDSDDELDFDDNFAIEEKSGSGEDSQSQKENEEVEERIPDSQPMATGAPTTNVGRKRTRQDPEPAGRPAPPLRRNNKGVRPSSIADVRRSLSSLLDDPSMSAGSVIPDSQLGSDSENDQEKRLTSSASSNKENRRPGSAAVVDRISLRRADSSSMSNASNRLAFAAPSASSGGGFRVPALLRRATTNSLMSQSSTSTSSSAGTTTQQSQHKSNAFSDDAKLKKNAAKKSGINFFARENERRERLAENERRREEKKWKGAEGRSKVVGGLFGGGQFE